MTKCNASFANFEAAAQRDRRYSSCFDRGKAKKQLDLIHFVIQSKCGYRAKHNEYENTMV